MISKIATVAPLPGLLIVSLSFVVACAEVAAEKPNVLFLICDDLNCDLGCYGHPMVKSQNIDQLAQRGVRFENAYCQYPLCGPSRASLMTGLYPDQTLVRRNPIFIRERLPNVVTLPQAFRAEGYFATRIGKIFHYAVPAHIGTSGHDDPYSWDYTINPRGRDKEDEHLIFSVKPGEYGGYMSWLAADGADSEQTDGIAATEAVALIEKFAKQDRRFFLAVGLYRPHTPYVAPKKYFEKYPPKSINVPTVPAGYADTIPPAALATLRKKPEHYNISEENARKATQAYYASISFSDAQVGRILDALNRTGIAKDTIVVFTSDHGYHLGEHGHWLKTSLFENAARVPLIIAGPGVTAAGHSTSSLAELTDIYPTLAELIGIPRSAHLSGVSLAPVLRDPSATPRASAMTQLKDTSYSIRTARFRYTQWGEEGIDGAELYDHRSDPAEMKNLADDPGYRDVRLQLAKQLHDRIDQARQPPEGIEQVWPAE